MQLIVASNCTAVQSAAFVSLSPCSPAAEWDGACPLTSQGCSGWLLILKLVKHPVTVAASATEKPRRKLVLVPEVGLNRQHHVLGSKQKWSFVWGHGGFKYLFAPSPPPFSKHLSWALLLLSLLCAHGSTQEPPSLGSGAWAGSAAHRGGLSTMQQGPQCPPLGGFCSPGIAARRSAEGS